MIYRIPNAKNKETVKMREHTASKRITKSKLGNSGFTLANAPKQIAPTKTSTVIRVVAISMYDCV